MAKKNFDDFINSAGKKPKLTPDEVEAMAKQLHQPSAEPVQAKQAALHPKARKVQAPKPQMSKSTKPIAEPKSGKPIAARAIPNEMKASKEVMLPDAPKEKVRITIDLAKDLYKRMKLAVVHNDTEISAYVRSLIENDLARQ